MRNVWISKIDILWMSFFNISSWEKKYEWENQSIAFVFNVCVIHKFNALTRLRCFNNSSKSFFLFNLVSINPYINFNNSFKIFSMSKKIHEIMQLQWHRVRKWICLSKKSDLWPLTICCQLLRSHLLHTHTLYTFWNTLYVINSHSYRFIYEFYSHIKYINRNPRVRLRWLFQI